jgi:type IV pilus assembly protein PilX
MKPSNLQIITGNSLSIVLRSRQGGVVLLIALVALVAMTLAGLALMRSVDTTGLLSGNFAFRQSGLHATDTGIEAAYSALASTYIASMNTNAPSACTTGCNYYATEQTVDTNGIPSNINWANVTATTVGGIYSVQYVIDRLCTATTTATNIASVCYSGAAAGSGTKKAGGITFTSAQQIYYRITARVSGPRNSVSFAQAIVTE